MSAFHEFQLLPVELQELVVNKLDLLTWMNYQFANGKSVGIPITRQEWDDAVSEFSETKSTYSQESYDTEKGFSSSDEED